jgi:hypothetical protein
MFIRVPTIVIWTWWLSLQKNKSVWKNKKSVWKKIKKNKYSFDELIFTPVHFHYHET